MQPFAPSGIKVVPLGSRAFSQLEDGSFAAPLSPQHHAPHPPQTPPPAHRNQPPYSLMRASCVGETMLQVLNWV